VPPALLEEGGIGTKSHYGARIAMRQQCLASPRTGAGEADIPRLRNCFAFIRARSQDRIDPSSLHDEIEQIELTPHVVRLGPTLRIGTHDAISAGSNSL